MTATSGVVYSIDIPESLVGDGTHCPGCGVPFLTERPGQIRDRAVNTGIAIEFEGVLVLCEPCIKLLASHVDMVDLEKAKVRASDVRRSERRDAKVREAADAVKAAHEAAHFLCASLEAIEEELGL